MSYPPPPGGPPYPPPPQGGMPGQYGGPPPQQPWPPQQQWGPQPQWAPGPPRKKRDSGWKWGLGALALLVVVGVTAAVTISITRGNGGGSGDPAPSGNDYGLASAGDKGPATVITEEPTCGAWRSVIDALRQVQLGGWDKIDRSIPASEWTSEQRDQYEAVGAAMRTAADRTVRLAETTPHRVVRELYEQFIAYARAYSDSVRTYEPVDRYLATTASGASSAVTNICTTIEYGAAEAWGPLVANPAPPSRVPDPSDPNNPTRFMMSPDAQCPEWDRLLHKFQDDTAAWEKLDPAVAATDWTTEQRAIADSLAPVITTYADDVESLGRKSDLPLIEDLAVLAAQYRRAFVQALPTYTSADSYLSGVAVNLTNIVFDACKAAGA